jgi:hypothetical protein
MNCPHCHKQMYKSKSDFICTACGHREEGQEHQECLAHAYIANKPSVHVYIGNGSGIIATACEPMQHDGVESTTVMPGFPGKPQGVASYSERVDEICKTFAQPVSDSTRDLVKSGLMFHDATGLFPESSKPDPVTTEISGNGVTGTVTITLEGTKHCWTKPAPTVSSSGCVIDSATGSCDKPLLDISLSELSYEDVKDIQQALSIECTKRVNQEVFQALKKKYGLDHDEIAMKLGKLATPSPGGKYDPTH